ncbi:hypothetical protein [Desulfofarcimen acetoxidans]|uniref:hypothetical protein n=1 Tax=Desulfofarcimen acetoxidans TaxID=58138 RepID=UPI0005A6FB7B|nr:hypothetical protein [Desulfofarcimen acetoxidans]
MEESARLQIIYETAVSRVTRTPEAWAEYLRFTLRLYKYPFENALLVRIWKEKKAITNPIC